TRRLLRLCPFEDGPVPVDWLNSAEVNLDIAALEQQGRDGGSYAELPAAASAAKSYAAWEKTFGQWLRANQTLTLLQSPTLKAIARAGEAEGAFRARLQLRAREERDAGVEELRKKYAAKTATLEERRARADQRVERERAQAGSAKMDTFVAAGTALLGVLLGRKRMSVTTASRMGTAIRSAGRSYGQAGDVTRAQESADRVRQQMSDLDDELQAEITALGSSYDAQKEELESVEIHPKRSDIQVHFVGLGWGDEA
ncbi:MAG TPA: ATP-binding protein, partial [Gemmatimonadaceae bacterium]|nr:ATP-binding protein [Gemmatimonadaceae bacterium]